MDNMDILPGDPLARWQAYRSAPVRDVIGLMSGTSLDAVDVAWMRFDSEHPRGRLMGSDSVQWTTKERSLLLELASGGGDSEGIARAHFLVGHRFAEAARLCCEKWNVAPDAVGSHGQTVAHFPASKGELPPATLQIGAAEPIALALSCPVVHDFRTADLAMGGEGAPLVPAADALLFRSDVDERILLNIGGVANATLLPVGDGFDGVRGFDTGPGNLLIDRAAFWATGGKRGVDSGGAGGLAGNVDEEVLDRLRRLPLLRRAPPRSFGREDFGEALFGEVLGWRDWAIRPDDLLATLAAWTASATVDAITRWLTPRRPRLLVAGGGVHNRAVMRFLTELWQPGIVGLQSELGIPDDAKEAAAFAVLADATLRGVLAGLPAVTGARNAARLGSIYFP